MSVHFNDKSIYLPSIEADARSFSMAPLPQATMTASSRRALAYSAPWIATSQYNPETYISAFKSINAKDSAGVSNDG